MFVVGAELGHLVFMCFTGMLANFNIHGSVDSWVFLCCKFEAWLQVVVALLWTPLIIMLFEMCVGRSDLAVLCLARLFLRFSDGSAPPFFPFECCVTHGHCLGFTCHVRRFLHMHVNDASRLAEATCNFMCLDRHGRCVRIITSSGCCMGKRSCNWAVGS